MFINKHNIRDKGFLSINPFHSLNSHSKMHEKSKLQYNINILTFINVTHFVLSMFIGYSRELEENRSFFCH